MLTLMSCTETNMSKFPFAKELFEKLAIINSMSYYFLTLKEMGKEPIIVQPEHFSHSNFPKILPPIPVRYFEKYKIDVTIGEILQKIESLEAGVTEEKRFSWFIKIYFKDNETPCPEIVRKNIFDSIKLILIEKLNNKIPDEDFVREQSEKFLDIILNVVNLEESELLESHINYILHFIYSYEINFYDEQAVTDQHTKINTKINDMETTEEKIELLETYIQIVYHKALTRYQEKNANLPQDIQAIHTTQNESHIQILAKVLLHHIEPLPNEIKSHFNAEVYFSFTTFSERINYIKEKLGVIYNILKSHANFEQGSVDKFHSSINELIEEVKKNYDNMQQFFSKVFSKLNECKHPEEVILSLLDINKTILDKDSSIMNSYDHSVTDIADGSYMKETSTDLNVVGGVGLALESIKTTILSKSYSNVSLNTTSTALPYQLKEMSISGTQYTSFKIATRDKFTSSNLDYILEDNLTQNSDSNTTKFAIPLDQVRHTLAYKDEPELHSIINAQTINAVDSYGYTPLMVAAQNGNTEQVKFLVAQKANIYLALPNQLNALNLAISNGHEKTALFLIENTDIDINNANINKNTALHNAITVELVEVAYKLIAKGARLDVARLDDGFSVAHLAADKGFATLLQAMSKKEGFNINMQTASGKTPLHLAAKNGQLETINVLLRIGANHSIQDSQGWTPIIEALENGQHQLAEYLADITAINITTKSKQTASIIAVKNHQMGTFDKLLKRGEDPLLIDDLGHNAIYHLLVKGDYSRFTTLYERLHFDVNMAFPEGSALFVASLNRHNHIVNFLVQNKAEFISNQEGMNLLDLAVSADNISRLRSLISEESLINKLLGWSADKYQLLKRSIKHNSQNCFDELYSRLSVSEKITLKNDPSILLTALSNSSQYILRKTLDIFSDSNMPLDNNKNNAAHICVEHGMIMHLELLYEKGVKFTSPNSDGHTAFHIAILNKDKDIFIKLTSIIKQKYWPKDLFSFAIANDSADIIEHLKTINFTSKGVIDKTNSQTLLKLCKEGQIKKVNTLLSNYSIKDIEIFIDYAIKEGHLPVTELLLNRFQDNKVKLNKFAYFSACKYEQIELIKFFQSKNIVLTPKELSACIGSTHNKFIKAVIQGDYNKIEVATIKLQSALEKGNIRIIKYLINEGFPINTVFLNGKLGSLPFLHYLFLSNARIVKKILIQFSDKIDFAVKDINGNDLIEKLLKLSPANIEDRISLLTEYAAKDFTNLLLTKKSADSNFTIKKLFSSFNIQNYIRATDNEKLKTLALTNAIVTGDINTVKLLLESTGDINKRDEDGNTILMIAVKSNQLEIVKLLIKHDADIFIKDKMLNQPLHLAIIAGNEELAKYLMGIEHNFYCQNRDGMDPLMLAASKGMESILDFYTTSLKIMYSKNGYTALHFAAKFGQDKIIDKIIEMGFDVNIRSQKNDNTKLYGVTPLDMALSAGFVDVASSLIDAGALLSSTDSNGNNALQHAAMSNKEHVTLFIKNLKEYYNKDTQKKLLFSALVEDNVFLIRDLYLHATSLETVNDNGLSLIHSAIIHGAKKSLNFLIEQGININAYTDSGDAPLHIAIKKGEIDILHRLLSGGADINMRDSSEKTALFTACELGNYAAVLELVKYKPNFKKNDYYGVTPSQIALSNGHLSIVQLLFLLGDKSLIKQTSKIIPSYIKNAIDYHQSTIDYMKDENNKALNYQQNRLFVALKFNNLDAVKVILLTHPEFLHESDYKSNYATQYATEEARTIINNNHIKPKIQDKKTLIPNAPIAPKQNELNELIKIFIDEKLSKNVEQNLLNSLEPLLQKLDFSALTDYISEASFLTEDLLISFTNKTTSLLKSFEKLNLDAASNVFFTSYKWKDMIDSQLAEVVQAVCSYKNDNLSNWFFSFFNPIQHSKISLQTLNNNIILFKNFINSFNTNLSNVPSLNISFQIIGTEYLKQATNLMKCSKDKDFQAKYLDTIPMKLELDQSCNSFKAITKHMTVDRKIYFDNTNTNHSYIHNKASLLYLAAQVSEQNYTKMISFFSTLENENFEENEMIILSKIFFNADSSENDITTFISSAIITKEKVGTDEFTQLYDKYKIDPNIGYYIEISQLLASLVNKIDIEPLIKRYTNILDLKNEIRAHYKEYFSDVSINEDINTTNLLIKKFENVAYPLPKEQLENLRQKYLLLVEKCNHYKNLSLLQLIDEAKALSLLLKEDNSNIDTSVSLLSILRESFRYIIGIYPYDTQMMVVMALLEPNNEHKGLLAQVLTGEGKSTINTLLAAYKILSGLRHFDIITSSESLAIRDQKKYEIYYNHFYITSSHITDKNPDQEAFDAQIIYGTNYNFEFALLRTMISDKRYIVGTDREVSVDESDNLLIDTALNSARIAQDSGNNVAWIYQPVLKYVKHQLHSTTPNKLKTFLKKINPAEFFHNQNILTDEYLDTLINSAKIAMTKRISVDYVVEVDHETGKKVVIIVDSENTGHLNYGSRWSNGIHEFVEALNGLEPNQDSNTIAAISHPSFFNLYSKIYGLTGTIGGIEERQEIRKIYNLNYFDVPPHFKSQREAIKIKYISDLNEHNDAIINRIKKYISVGRPVLVLFNSIKETDVFSDKLAAYRLTHTVLNEMQESSDEYILQQAGLSGAITIATNTAGRGTDIILSYEAKESGGLAVIVTFLPQNMRVQDQACGRSGRQGQKGSCEIIITSDIKLLQYTTEEMAIKILLDNRDVQIKKLSLFRIERAEEEKLLFEMFKNFADDLHKIRVLINEIDYELLDNNYHEIVELPNGVCPKTDKIMDSLYKQGSTMIAHQTKGYSVDWKYYIQNVKHKFIESMEAKWAEYFSNYNFNHNSSSMGYQKFYDLNLKNIFENQEIVFGQFLNEVIEIASIYSHCDIQQSMNTKKEEILLSGVDSE